MRTLLLVSLPVLALASVACPRAASTQPPSSPPASQTQTTGAHVDPSYGTSDADNGWVDPAATGNATRGSAAAPSPAQEQRKEER